MEELTYTLTVTFNINAIDDPDARKHAKMLLNLFDVENRPDFKNVKLQEVKHKMIPRGIALNK